VRQRQEVQELPREAGLNRATIAHAPRALQTPRIDLHLPSAPFAPAFLAALSASLPDWSFVGFAQEPRDLAWAERLCGGDAQWIADGEAIVFYPFERASGALIGRIDLHTLDLDACRAEIGYVCDSRLTGRGLMREATLAVVEFGFEIDFERIEAMSDARNQRAVRFALGMGFEHEGVLRRHERDPQGELCDMVLLARLKPGDPRARSPT
jgi:RimJ/RimL family protein N-acetyltransferase